MKKLSIYLLALAFVLVPSLTMAAGVGSVVANKYLKLSNDYQGTYNNLVAKDAKIDLGLKTVKTTAKNKTKIQKVDNKLDQYLSLANKKNKEAKTLLSKATVSQSDYKLAKSDLGLVKKYLASAKTQEKEARRKLQNLGVKFN